MKTLDQIYKSIKETYYNRTKLEIAEGSVIDNFVNSVSDGIEEVYETIENNKNPHLFTKLEGSDIDSMGMLVGCARRPDEDDQTYLYRMINWNTSNQASNSTAVETALTSMTYASNVTYVPLTQGVGTATAYIIPKKLENSDLAIAETKQRLEDVISIGTYVDYVVPTLLPVKLVAYISASRDLDNVKANITSKVEEYINNIAPGDKLEIGAINKIGVNETNVNYFSLTQMYINSKEYQEISAIQKLEEKFLFDEIIWNVVVM
nr:MAG TPA: Baseplate J-like protein [Caudoviricetes sp.]